VSIATGNVNAQVEDDLTRQSEGQTAKAPTIYELIQSEPTLQSFETLVDAVGLNDNLQQDGPFTVFAPTNEAWAAFNLTAETETEMTITDAMLYHIVNGEYSANALAEHWALPTLAGKYLFFDATMAEADQSMATNGATDVTAEITLNESARIIRTDIVGSNGVIHIIDAVVPIPEGNSLFASELGSPELTIDVVLANDGRFNTFLALAEQAGLMDALQNTATMNTLFAPTDEAFDAVPEEMMADWLAETEGALNLILSFHLVPDRLSINQIATDDYLPTHNGRALVVTTAEDIQVYLNGRAVQEFNLLASNGVIHVVDEVILP
jgi:transforming growth factor-beta-induced protein